MLVLTRKVGEAIVIPQCGVTVTVLEIRGQKVRVGLAAPPEVQLHRQEVWERLTAEAGEVSPGAIAPGGAGRPPAKG
jgi:carbon storage regulator